MHALFHHYYYYFVRRRHQEKAVILRYNTPICPIWVLLKGKISCENSKMLIHTYYTFLFTQSLVILANNKLYRYYNRGYVYETWFIVEVLIITVYVPISFFLYIRRRIYGIKRANFFPASVLFKICEWCHFIHFLLYVIISFIF